MSFDANNALKVSRVAVSLKNGDVTNLLADPLVGDVLPDQNFMSLTTVSSTEAQELAKKNPYK